VTAADEARRLLVGPATVPVGPVAVPVGPVAVPVGPVAVPVGPVAVPVGPVAVRVPATSANLGPGFDTLGLALGLHDEVTASLVPEPGLHLEVTGEGADDVPRDERHLVVRAMRAAFARWGGQPTGGIRLQCTNRIPHARGLGSSAAAIVAGVLAARALTELWADERTASDADVLRLASELEGHPDNVAACLLGGVTIAWTEAAGARVARVEPAPELDPVVFVPAATASTEAVRRLLPGTVPHADAAANAGRAALLVHALTAAPGLLLPATEDRLHQPYRAPAMPDSADLVARLRAAGVAAVVSGAGPTVLALVPRGVEVGEPPAGWRVVRPGVDPTGAHVEVAGPAGAQPSAP
jgi:homoserine kinase